MQDEEKYKALLNSPSNEDHLLALELMQSQLQWPKEKAVGVALIHYIRQFKQVEKKISIFFGSLSILITVYYVSKKEAKDTWDVQHLYTIHKDDQELASHKGAFYKTIHQHSLIDLKSMQSTCLREFPILLPDLISLL